MISLNTHVSNIFPTWQSKAINRQLNRIKNEFNCLNWEGDQFVLTDRGRKYLESDDPGELMEWLVTRILGVDHVLVILRDRGSCSRAEMQSHIQQVNPGWTSTSVPNSIIRQLGDFDILHDNSGVLSLSDAGKEWAERIHWEPESLVPEKFPDRTEVDETATEDETHQVELPTLREICDDVSDHGHFRNS